MPVDRREINLHPSQVMNQPQPRGGHSDEGDDGVFGPVDFRNLTVREFGTIYEGLLESSLSYAQTDLTVATDRRRGISPPKPCF